MGTIELISASAGSGKTTRIARELAACLADGTVRPEAVLATTFTRRAAQELKERARTDLFRAGQAEAALRLDGARIGTVNAVCGRLVADFAFELGVSPDQRVLDDDQASAHLKEVIARLVSAADLDTLAGLRERFDDFDLQAIVYEVLQSARTNGLGSDALAASGKRSVSALHALLPRPARDARALDDAVEQALRACVARVPVTETSTAGTTKALADVQRALAASERGPLSWSWWAKLAKIRGTAESERHLEGVREAAEALLTHPRLRADLAEAITLVFDVAARALDGYAQEKRAWGAIDFVDQEVLALQLLSTPALAERLSAELDLVLVDEFQDTSPLQLALFTRLATLARRSVWVGDQKQSIFGFRGTDPALMDAALAAVLGTTAPEVLGTSYRSRPRLVQLTSALFGDAFADQGIPRERVVLAPQSLVEPKGLGPEVEWWTLEGGHGAERTLALADGVQRLLADPTLRVRDRDTDAARPARASDVAVLCRTNAQCQALAAALAHRGLGATVHRGGLLSTPEGRAGVLALRLFVDPGDRLAAAELALLLHHAHAPEAWLDAVLSRGDEAVASPPPLPFADAPFHAALEAARRQHPLAGPLAALDAAVEAVALREACLGWGAAPMRLANLDALRAHAVQAVATFEAQGRAATAAGLVVALEALDGDGDTQARVPGADAVVVSTWHRAKGLEWPVTVVAMNGPPEPRLFGVAVQSTAAPFDLRAPLEGRWVRYWPNPFHARQRTALHERLEASPHFTAAEEALDSQELRLLYVAFTRARDRLVLVPPKRAGDLPLDLLPPKGSGPVTWAGTTVEVLVREGRALLAEAPPPQPGLAPAPAGPTEFPSAWRSPSAVEAPGATGAVLRLGPRLPVPPTVDMNALGQAVHGFLAVDRPTLPAATRRHLAQRCLAQWEQETALAPEALVAASEALAVWAAQRWPGATWHRELPLTLRADDGSVLRGTADLVLRTRTGFVVVDHKSFPGDDAAAAARAGTWAGQLGAYAEALQAAWGAPCEGTFIHLPVAGLVAEVLQP